MQEGNGRPNGACKQTVTRRLLQWSYIQPVYYATQRRGDRSVEINVCIHRDEHALASQIKEYEVMAPARPSHSNWYL